MQEILSSTTASLKQPRERFFKTQESTFYSAAKHSPEPTTEPSLSATSKTRSRVENEQQDIFRKYSEFMNNQNNMITKILVEGNRSDMQEELAHKLRDSANQFIRGLLNELSEVYAKMRASKSTSEQRIGALEMELLQERQKNSTLKQQFYEQWSSNSQKCNVMVRMAEQQLRDSVASYQSKIQYYTNELESKQAQIDTLVCEKLRLSNDLTQCNRLLRLERENAAEKVKEYKGMEMLVEEYQIEIAKMVEELQAKNRDEKVAKAEKQSLQFQISKMKVHLAEKEGIVAQKQQRIELLAKQVCSLKQRLTAGQQKLTQQSQQNNMRSKEQLNQLKTLQDKERKLRGQVDELNNQLKQAAREKTSDQEKINNFKTEIKKQKLCTKARIESIEKMFKTKQKLLGKMVNSKIRQLRKQKDSLKEYIQRQIFNFYQEVKVDLILGKVPQMDISYRCHKN